MWIIILRDLYFFKEISVQWSSLQHSWWCGYCEAMLNGVISEVPNLTKISDIAVTECSVVKPIDFMLPN
jgi:hypothetical protein